ncbi:4,5-DOPA dioxygenase extradiol [Ignatzschineria rhizosphaerae]|uniref:4,5-DOPA dioxygenase extradiol n=1 Tax=Ignatzschineria rhizosphaerae TaxID=2923279 RepID=A0ABY3X1K9_9GAMM|nr:4,5-DOPA dioxygenase extradiol [Ignatzschineria rhizosphaerae]UNM95342.1 4,5-DOPA dioxygenase extradiol [Ignatzschineria rhizosphaerae]
MNLQQLQTLTQKFKTTQKMPILFLGHGSPMNAISSNRFTESWNQLGQSLPKPQAILSISAHWETKGSFVTAMEKPQTIHDFYNFPQALYDMTYPAEGDPNLAKHIHTMNQHIELDHKWGLDHGTWAVICHLYPDADIPTLQLSLDMSLSPDAHYELAKCLSTLRHRGVLILASGNIVHNLRLLDFRNSQGGHDWAEDARQSMTKMLLEDDQKSLIHFKDQGEAFRLSIPTDEHYLPLLYILGLKESSDELLIFNNQSVMGSLAMTSLLYA